MKPPKSPTALNAQSQSWGRYPKATQVLHPIHWRTEPLPNELGGKKLLPYGQGRSYGDCCLNDQNILLGTNALNHLISFNSQTGALKAEAGITLKEILEFSIAHSWFLPVVPGTEYVSLGGAIANDIHGKNHHRLGSFGNHVKQFDLLRSEGEFLNCSRTQNSDFFRATIGGLGLTGLITAAEIQLIKIESPFIIRETRRFRHLSEFFELTADSDKDWTYTVGWLDSLAHGSHLGRGVFFRGNHAPHSEKNHTQRTKEFAVPCDAPEFILNRFTMNSFNRLYYATHPDKEAELIHYRPFFFPLDSLLHWNRLYGKRGFLQYQCVVPYKGTDSSIREVISEFGKSGLGSFLTVIKTFGEIESLGLMSFPKRGVTLTLDIPFGGEKTLSSLERLDAIVSGAGGRVYPAKDARMSKQSFEKYFPNLNEFKKFVDPNFSSSLWRRLT